MKKWHLWISIIAIAFLGFLFSQDTLARIALQKYNRLDIALWLVRRDADLAMFIGNYYFNGVIGGGEYNPDVAKKAFEKAISINHKILWGHYQLARIYFVKGDYTGAISEINRELEANPENLRSLYVRGLIYGYRGYPGDLANAEEDFQRFTEWAPKEWAGYNDLSWILSKQGKYSEAEKTINLALKEALDAESNPWLWNSLGVAQLNLKKYQNAKISFGHAKQMAEKMTEEEWRHSYPGNNTASAEEGLSAFLKAINENFRQSNRVD